MNETREKILLLLLGGLALGFCYTPNQTKRVFRFISYQLGKLTENELRQGINYLYKLRYIDEKQYKKGFFKIVVTEKGRLKALNYKLSNIKTKKGRWDGKWRMVAFDIPEKFKISRDILCRRLKEFGFCELQKSVLITPYNCEKEIVELVDFFKLKKYVRFGVLESLDNSQYFEKIFKL